MNTLTPPESPNKYFDGDLNDERQVLIHAIKNLIQAPNNRISKMFPNIKDDKQVSIIRSIMLNSKLIKPDSNNMGETFILMYETSINVNQTSTEKVVNDYLEAKDVKREEEYRDNETKWYNNVEAKRKYDDYPILKKQRNALFVIALIEAIAILIGLFS